MPAESLKFEFAVLVDLQTNILCSTGPKTGAFDVNRVNANAEAEESR